MLLFIVAAMTAVCGCAEKKSSGSIMKEEFDGAPDWVTKSSSDSAQICGVGSAAGTRNPSMARTDRKSVV